MKQTSLVSNPGSATYSYVNLTKFLSLSELHLLHMQNGHNKPKLARFLQAQVGQVLWMHLLQSSVQGRFSIHDKHCLSFIFIMEIKLGGLTISAVSSLPSSEVIVWETLCGLLMPSSILYHRKIQRSPAPGWCTQILINPEAENQLVILFLQRALGFAVCRGIYIHHFWWKTRISSCSFTVHETESLKDSLQDFSTWQWLWLALGCIIQANLTWCTNVLEENTLVSEVLWQKLFA